MKNIISFISRHKLAFVAVFAIVAATLLGGFTAIDPAAAQIFDEGRDLPDNIANAGGDRTLREVILLAINFVLGFVGLLAVIMLIYGGFQFMVGGEESKDKARNTIIYAIVGVLIILFSFAIVNTVFNVTTGSDTGSGSI